VAERDGGGGAVSVIVARGAADVRAVALDRAAALGQVLAVQLGTGQRSAQQAAVDAAATDAHEGARLQHGRLDLRDPRRASQVEAEEAAVIGAAHLPAVGVLPVLDNVPER